jgi:hypothetical protein
MADRTPSQRGKHSKGKGRRGEQRVATLYRSIYGDKIRRGNQGRRGDDEADVEGTPFFLEVKTGKVVSVLAALRQAEEAKDSRPVVCHVKIDRTDAYVAMPESDWMQIVKRLVVADAVIEADLPW